MKKLTATKDEKHTPHTFKKEWGRSLQCYFSNTTILSVHFVEISVFCLILQTILVLIKTLATVAIYPSLGLTSLTPSISSCFLGISVNMAIYV